MPTRISSAFVEAVSTWHVLLALREVDGQQLSLLGLCHPDLLVEYLWKRMSRTWCWKGACSISTHRWVDARPIAIPRKVCETRCSKTVFFNRWEACPKGGQTQSRVQWRAICPSTHGWTCHLRPGLSRSCCMSHQWCGCQVPRHRTVSLFSGCLGLELGWKQQDPKFPDKR